MTNTEIKTYLSGLRTPELWRVLQTTNLHTEENTNIVARSKEELRRRGCAVL